MHRGPCHHHQSSPSSSRQAPYSSVECTAVILLPYKTQAQRNGNQLTKDGPGRDGLLVDPEGHLGQDDRHDAGDVGLDQEEAHLPLQVEVHCHDDVLACQRDDTQHHHRESLH